mmetsp:Transcript_32523/g.85412  ORF Transcript_32523/g.85412 Transcript_32523/m.85412 type:complete len:563 (+) Transcript_32523:96-1784(+)
MSDAEAYSVASGWSTATIVGVIAIICGVAAYALWISYREHQRLRRSGVVLSPEEFITARGRVSSMAVGFSWFATLMGSWVLATTPNYSTVAGLLGVVMYAVAGGAAIVMLAYIGAVARLSDPDACSLPNFMARRFAGRAPASGRVASALAVGMNLFNSCVGLTAEYTTMLSLLESFAGVSMGESLGIVVLISILTLIYTVTGGLYVSILTDRMQTIGALALVGVLIVYVCLEFSKGLSLPPLTHELAGLTTAGYSSILTMPLSLMLGAGLFAEGMWQRVWAGEDRTAIVHAAWFAGVCATMVIFFFGFIGLLALWSDRATVEQTDPNLFFFAFFGNSPRVGLSNVPGLLAMLCAAVMSTGAVDSLQNAIAATASSSFLHGHSLLVTRLFVAAVNTVILALACARFSVLSLFLAGNLAAAVLSPPVMVSLVAHRRVRALLTEASLLLGLLGGAGGLSAYGIVLSGGAYGEGLRLAWVDNGYRYDFFLVALATSMAGVIIGVGLGFVVRAQRSDHDGIDTARATFADEFWGGHKPSELAVPKPTGGVGTTHQTNGNAARNASVV